MNKSGIADMYTLGTSVDIVLPMLALDTVADNSSESHRDRWEVFLGELAQGFTCFSAHGMWRGCRENLYFYKVSFKEDRLESLIQYLRELRETLGQEAIFFSIRSEGLLLLSGKY